MKKILFILGFSILSASCSDDLSSLNTDEKNPAVVPAYTLFTSAERSLSDQMVNTNVNRNIFRLTCQYWTETTYTDESNYDFVTRKISDNHWNALYAGTLADLYKAKEYTDSEVIPANDPAFAEKTAIKKNKLAQIDILIAYTYQVLVDTFGDVPYSEALLGQSNYLPKYDKGVDIYKALIIKLSNSVANINDSYSGFKDADVIYSDNLINWKAFANSIKLKLGINLLASGLDNTTATNAINSAITSGLISSNSSNAKVPYMATVPNTNPLYSDLVASGRHDFVVTKTVVNKMIALNDPRRSIYTDGNSNGGTVGASNSYSSRTHVGSIIETPDFSGTLLDYAEVEFLLAEAAERGISAAGSAETHYNNAITASMEDWGVASSAIATYLAQPTVAYTTATGTWQQKIGEQAWLGLYNRGFEGWTSYRRLNYPVLTAPATANAAAEGKVPVRMQYPIREQTLNPTNYNAASSAIGGDKLTTKLFWDIN
ncbi:SusD-like starch-binding protein associating with outer membrane [Flavobacterium croceum DSM 17960]|uniref:SusD-like starch-binding protein associating with outer membrane n=1 Tax=Flavobacterium croceum DSM 17960 TaxID=1121886 RepID=A0A2S4N9P0_9FLAO|nr:SusD/RagB family nutrient-binding outer membrane lipoprotein [Flavobacterium croceum]POS02416.1 SusD-like starch-binding protein associating with outer membrane [Flavobacterium croceum DSM 17960]